MSKTVFITGASSGLGKAVAIMFAQRDWNVIATMRNPAAGEDLRTHSSISVLPLDVSDAEQIRMVVASVLTENTVDVVVNNAGFGLAGAFEGVTDAQLIRQIETNLLGVMRVTQAFLPHFRERHAGTFIAITSIGGHIALPFNSVYHATKWGLEGWNESLAYELAPFGIRAKTVAPGGIRTDFAGRSLALSAHPAYTAMVEKARSVFDQRGSSRSSAEQIAEVVYEAATDGKPEVRYIAGKDAKLMIRLRRWLGYHRFDAMIRKRFLG